MLTLRQRILLITPVTIATLCVIYLTGARNLPRADRSLGGGTNPPRIGVVQSNLLGSRKDIAARPRKVLAVVGVQTGFSQAGQAAGRYDYEKRRAVLRAAWFPATRGDLDRLEKDSGVLLRFVIGRATGPNKNEEEAALAAEAERHGGFMRLPMEEAYLSLALKTLTFLKTVSTRYTAEYIVKVDDDVYLSTARIPAAVRQWRHVEADYVGCMKMGAIFTDPAQRWYEPQHALLGGKTYFTHTWGPLYVVSGRAAGFLASLPAGALRFFNNEDVTVGSWMLAFNVTHLDDRRLCETGCSATSLGVYDFPDCAGLCQPAEAMPRLHASAACRPATGSPASNLPMLPPIIRFSGEM